MRNTLRITVSVAALVAGIGLASAQGLKEHQDAPAATPSEQKAPQGDSSQQKSTLPQKNEKMKPAPTAQAPGTVKPAPTAQTEEKTKPAPTAQTEEKTKPAPTAQTQEKTKPAPTAQTQEKTNPAPTAQAPTQGAAPSAAAQQKGSTANASAAMTTEQNVKFRETLRAEKTERLTGVQFSISIGDEVPATVRFHRLPARIVEYAPQYRDFDYILVGDDILILDPRSHRIVAVIPA
jgi:outer membrane biosynthesis protein TonB